MNKEYLPKNKYIWICMDLCNGHKPTKRYCWWFDTKKEALSHRRFQHKNKLNARLSKPIKCKIINERKCKSSR
jgi:hypothetical protein